MAKLSTPSKSPSAYQKYFDTKSLKSVASCAAMVFIIVHLIDYLWSYSIPLRVLNLITLTLCLLISFLFVVNELGRIDEKIILGVANAALLFFSVIGFNSTITSNALVNNRNAAERQPTIKEKTSQLIPLTNQMTKNASLFTLFRVRTWMPSIELEKKIDTLADENRALHRAIELKSDSIAHLKNILNNIQVIGNPHKIDNNLNNEYARKIDSLQKKNWHLQTDLQKCLSIADHPIKSPAGVPKTLADTGFMDKANYITSYKTIKQKFESDLKRCQQEANEYKSKYNILIRQSQGLMDRIREGEN